MSTFTLIQHSSESPSHRNQTRRKINILIKKEAKLLLFAEGIILYIENLKDSTQKLINEISKAAEY